MRFTNLPYLGQRFGGRAAVDSWAAAPTALHSPLEAKRELAHHGTSQCRFGACRALKYIWLLRCTGRAGRLLPLLLNVCVTEMTAVRLSLMSVKSRVKSYCHRLSGSRLIWVAAVSGLHPAVCG